MATPGPAPNVTDKELKTAIKECEKPFATVATVAEEVSLSGTRVRMRLNDLADDGEIERAEIGNGGVVIYWLEESELAAKNRRP